MIKALIFFRSGFLTAIFVLLTVTAIAQSEQLNADLQNSFSKFDLIQVRAEHGLRDAGNAKILRFHAHGRNIELSVEPREMRSSQFRAEDAIAVGVRQLDKTLVTTFRGKVSGEERSTVRLSIDSEKIEGFFTSRGERYFIEPATRYSRFASREEFIVYRAEDSLIEHSFSCPQDVPARIEHGKPLVANSLNNPQAFRRIELATEADFEYVSTLGGANQANNEILGILNMIEGVYESELQLTISVVYQHTWSTGDPFGGANTEAVVRNFQNYWNASFPTSSYPRDAAHIFTGKSYALSQGWAFISVMCSNPNFAYGLSGYVDWAPAKFLLTGHELGHNLGANHVDAAQGCANSLMNPQLTASTPLSFCPFSRNEIGNFVSANGSCLAWAAPARFDFDGDSRSDIAVFRPASGNWYQNLSTAGFNAFQFGQNGDKPLSADFDGDAKSDPAVYRNGIWYRLLSMTNTFDAVGFGLPSDIPTPADFDGDGRADIAVYRPLVGIWYRILSANNLFSAVHFGTTGDVPIPADYDGDGKADINVFRPSSGFWYRLNSSNNSFSAVFFGLLGDKALAGDFDGDGRADIAVWRPSGGVWYILRSSNNSFYGAAFGISTDLPVPADFDGDGRCDLSVFRPSNGTWYRLNSSNNAFSAMPFGTSTDIPVLSYYVL